MNTTTITVTDVETKEGVSQKTGKPWKMFKIVDQGGNRYSTFDGGIGQQAFAAKGQLAEITYEIGERGNDLKALRPTGQAAPVAAPPAAKANGDTDWDLIGLRKTRCALWAAGIQSEAVQGMPASAAATWIRELVLQAERDIFARPPVDVSIPDSDIPF